MTARRIHPTAVVDRRAELDADVEVGPYAIVEAGARIGRGTRLLAHAIVHGAATLGAENVVHPFAVIGGAPQAKRLKAASLRAEIGDRNVIREHVTIHGGTERPTRVGDGNLLMVGVHVAHDAVVGSNVVAANAVQLAGHVEVADHANLGGLAAVAQFVKIGESAFVAGGAMCERDVPPFVIVQGDRARVRAVNIVGLRRRGVPEESIARLERAIRAIFHARDKTRAEAMASIDRGDRFVDALMAALMREG